MYFSTLDPQKLVPLGSNQCYHPNQNQLTSEHLKLNKRKEDYDKVKASGIIDKNLVSDLYLFRIKDKISIFEFDKVGSIKITLPREIPSGNVGDTDIYGAQQQSPLYEVLIPWD